MGKCFSTYSFYVQIISNRKQSLVTGYNDVQGFLAPRSADGCIDPPVNQVTVVRKNDS